MPYELVYFHKGFTSEARSALKPAGVLDNAINIAFDVEGTVNLRPMFKRVHEASLGEAIHSGTCFRDTVIVGCGNKLLRQVNGEEFKVLYSLFSSEPWVFREYKDFLHAVNNTFNILIDRFGNVYPAVIGNPSTVPSGAAGGAGQPSGTYKLYVSFKIIWPNKMVYETGLSAGSDDVTVTTNQISWSNIPTCTYQAWAGQQPTIHRKLYRGPGSGGALAGIYYVATIEDNTTTTYMDNQSDSQLAAHGKAVNEDYIPCPENALYMTYHNGRCFTISKDNIYRLTYSEAAAGADALENEVIMPIALKDDNFDDIRVSGFTGAVVPKGLLTWGSSLWIPLAHTWVRKQQDDPDTWAYRKTFSAKLGVMAPQSLDILDTPPGMVSVSLNSDGRPTIAFFDGNVSVSSMAAKIEEFLKTNLDIKRIEESVGKVSGRYYHVLFPTIGKTEFTHLVLDLGRQGDVRCSLWEGIKARTLWTDEDTKDLYIGSFDGYIYKRTTSGEAIDFTVQTHNLSGGDQKVVNHIKTISELRYNLDSGGADVNMEIWFQDDVGWRQGEWEDGSTVKKIRGSTDEVQVLDNLPVNFKGYQFYIKLYGYGMSHLVLYGPWSLKFEMSND